MKVTTDSLGVLSSKVMKVNQVKQVNNSNVGSDNTKHAISEMTDSSGNPTKEAYKIAVNKLNEFMESTNRNSKFIFHDGLEKFYVEIVDSITQEVVKEIPPKELLDAYYEMQKLVGKIFDTQA